MPHMEPMMPFNGCIPTTSTGMYVQSITLATLVRSNLGGQGGRCYAWCV